MSKYKTKRTAPQVLASLCALELQLFAQTGNEIFQMSVLECVPQLLVFVDRERIQIHSNCARKYNRILQQQQQQQQQCVGFSVYNVLEIDKRE